MAILLVTYDLRRPGRNYDAVHEYLRGFTHCKGMESVYLLDTNVQASTIRDSLQQRVDANDVVFVGRLIREWASVGYTCGAWLNDAARNW